MRACVPAGTLTTDSPAICHAPSDVAVPSSPPSTLHFASSPSNASASRFPVEQCSAERMWSGYHRLYRPARAAVHVERHPLAGAACLVMPNAEESGPCGLHGIDVQDNGLERLECHLDRAALCAPSTGSAETEGGRVEAVFVKTASSKNCIYR